MLFAENLQDNHGNPLFWWDKDAEHAEFPPEFPLDQLQAMFKI